VVWVSRGYLSGSGTRYDGRYRTGILVAKPFLETAWSILLKWFVVKYVVRICIWVSAVHFQANIPATALRRKPHHAPPPPGLLGAVKTKMKPVQNEIYASLSILLARPTAVFHAIDCAPP
jgi:hypothetical protein